MVEKKIQDFKKKKKKWIPILAGKEFGNQQIGETYVEESENCLGRFINTNLMMLTKDPKKQNFNVQLKIKEVKNNEAYTELIGYSIQVAQLKRITRKGKNKIDDSFNYRTKDNVNIIIKPILLTVALTYKTTLQQLRKITRQFLAEYTKKHDFSDIMSSIINNSLQKDIKNNSKKIHPIINCIIKSAYKIE